MKGNEARVVFFLHAVDKFKEGKVQREDSNSGRGKEEGGASGALRGNQEEVAVKSQKTERLLNTNPYYLAITRSSCEVRETK